MNIQVYIFAHFSSTQVYLIIPPLVEEFLAHTHDTRTFSCSLQLKLLNWRERPLLNVAQTHLLLNKLQELSIAKLRPDFINADLPLEALNSVRLALATNLGRAILEE